jgi:imidazolonepropionase-like amidohydrolase
MNAACCLRLLSVVVLAAGAGVLLLGEDALVREGSAAGAPPARLAIRAARVIPVVGPERAPGVVTIEEGRIVAVGSEAPPGVEVLDFGSGVIVPGLVDAHSHLGSPFDVEEDVDAFDDRLRALDAFDPLHEAIPAAARAGVTTIVFAPGEGNVISGLASTIKMGNARAPLLAEAGLQFTLASDATKPLRAPTSRMGLLGMLRERLRGAGRHPRSPLHRTLRGEVPALVHARTASEIVAAIDLVREFDLRAAILHADEGYRVAGELAAARLAVACGPLTPDQPERILRNPALLEAAGVPVAFMSEAPVMPPASLRSSAALALQHGMSREAALRAITLEAARVAGVDARVGSLEPGKDADLVVLSGDPLDLSASVLATFIDGIPVYRRKTGAPERP